MTTTEHLFAILQEDSALAALFGGAVRIAHGVAAPGTVEPWTAYQRVSGEEQNSHSGTDDMRRSRFQFTTYGKNPMTVEAIGDRMVQVLNCEDRTTLGERVTIFNVDDDDGYESDTGLHFRRLDFEVWRSTTSQ